MSSGEWLGLGLAFSLLQRIHPLAPPHPLLTPATGCGAGPSRTRRGSSCEMQPHTARTRPLGAPQTNGGAGGAAGPWRGPDGTGLRPSVNADVTPGV